MAGQNLVQLAKRGDGQAIATLMNRQMQPKGITATATVENDCLQIILEAERVPNQQRLCAWVQKSVTNLGAASIKKVKVEGRQTGETSSAWSQTFEIPDQPAIPVNGTAERSVKPPATIETEQPSLKQRAKQGDAEAIATLLNFGLQHKKMTAKVSQKTNGLQVVVMAAEVPDETVATTLISRELKNLKSDAIEIVKIYGKRTGDEVPAWSKEIELIGQAPPTSPNPALSANSDREHQIAKVTESGASLQTKENLKNSKNKKNSSGIKIKRWQKIVLIVIAFFIIPLLFGEVLRSFFLFWGFAALTGYIAVTKKRNFALWFCLGFAFNILSLIVIILMPQAKKEKNSDTQKDINSDALEEAKSDLRSRGLLGSHEGIVFNQLAIYKGGIRGYPKSSTDLGIAFLSDSSFIFCDHTISWKLPYTRTIDVSLDFYQMTEGRALLASGDVGRQLQQTKNTLQILYFDEEGVERDARFEVSGALTIAGQEVKAREFINYFLEFKGRFARKSDVGNRSSANNNESDPISRLEKLNQLKEQGIITNEEFEAKKGKLLDQL